ncbi:hypothetical protein Nit79A3_1418 [Nitrosomonas sp. Is79A3]|uniref:hypothetical protein n=1 Tax=Nitrosomonas sp. (strain Is79A3) TaxID=261292 RepID=UPI000215CFEB
MAAKPKLTPEEWKKVRNTWESDPREGYAWLVESMALPVSAPGVRKVSLRDKWKKSEKPSKSTKTPKETINSESKSKVSKVSQRNHAKVSETIDIETINDDSEDDDESDNGSVGRPTGYREKYNKQAYRLCLLGAIDDELAEFFEVDVSTIKRWKKNHAGFRAAIKKGKIAADSKVAERLYERAMGYSHPETHVSNYKGEITKTELIKHYPPDTAAAFILLKNRHPDKWKDKIELKEDINLNVFPPKEELDAIYDRALEEARKRNEMLIGRRERIGIVIDHDSGLIDD